MGHLPSPLHSSLPPLVFPKAEVPFILLSLCLSPTGPRSELNSFPLEDPEKERPPFSHCLPRRFSFACWLTVGSISLVSAFFTVLYSLEMSRDEAGHWAINILLSVLQNIFVMQPLKVTWPYLGCS